MMIDIEDHQDIKKYREEKHYNLAAENPLSVREQIIRVVTARGILERTYINVQRSRNAKVYKLLPGSMVDAHNEIELIFMRSTGKVSVKTAQAMFGIIHGRGKDPLEYSAMEITYHEWYSNLAKKKPTWLSLCLNICGLGHSIEQASSANRLSAKQGSRALRNGLNDYCIRRGWGDQLKKV